MHYFPFLSGACKSASESSYKSSNEAFLFPEQQIDTEPDPDEGCNSADEDEEQGDVDEKEEMENVKKFQGDLRKCASRRNLSMEWLLIRT